MRMCEARYEGTTKLAMIVQKLVTFAAHESRKLNRQPMVSWPSASAPEDGSEIKDWLGVLVKHPKLYLRVSMSLDLSMARGKYPNQRDMPESLFWGHSENEPATLAAGSLLGRNINVGLAGEIRKPNRTAPSIPRALGNIAMEFSFSPKARWMRDPAKEGTDFDVNLDFMEINVNDATAKRNQAHQTATDEREGLEDDILDWPVDLSGES